MNKTELVYRIADIEYKVASAKCRVILDESNNPEFLKVLIESREMLGKLLNELIQPANTEYFLATNEVKNDK